MNYFRQKLLQWRKPESVRALKLQCQARARLTARCTEALCTEPVGQRGMRQIWPFLLPSAKSHIVSAIRISISIVSRRSVSHSCVRKCEFCDFRVAFAAQALPPDDIPLLLKCFVDLPEEADYLVEIALRAHAWGGEHRRRLLAETIAHPGGQLLGEVLLQVVNRAEPRRHSRAVKARRGREGGRRLVEDARGERSGAARASCDSDAIPEFLKTDHIAFPFIALADGLGVMAPEWGAHIKRSLCPSAATLRRVC